MNDLGGSVSPPFCAGSCARKAGIDPSSPKMSSLTSPTDPEVAEVLNRAFLRTSRRSLVCEGSEKGALNVLEYRALMNTSGDGR
jgi:hypothetical protein